MFDKCKGNRFEKESHPQQVSSLWFILLLILFCVLFWAFYFNFYALPRPNLSEDDSGPTFNSRNARTYLRNLTEHGPKVAGSELNEVFAVDYLVDELEKIRVNMHQNHEMDVDVQVANGSLHLASSFHYQGLKNVVVRLRNRGVEDPDHCLLINSHFDTVAVSPGGGDATTLISVMLETVRILAEQEETFEHGIIFLFNGLEETGLQGSHAFITQHPWASSAKALLNLDSAGNGGREILFQASKGHTWLMNYYRRYALHPFTSAMGEELFQGGFIPSDTDFRIFRDYGGVPGLDMAYITNGYVYHTEHDTEDIVSDNTLQHTGDNVLALVRALANALELKDTEAHMGEDAIFFDFINAFMIYYTKHEAVIINVVIISFCVLLQIVQFVLNGPQNCTWIIPTILVQLIFLFIGCAVAVGLGLFYDSIDRSMSWYNNSFMIFPLYMCPMLFCMAIGPAVLRRFAKKMDPWQSVECMLNVHSWILIVLLIASMILDIRSGFMVMVPLFFYTISLMIQIILKYFKLGARWKLVAHYLVQITPFAFYATWTVVSFATFIPISGRNGVSANPELIISVLAVGMGLLLAGFLIPTIPMFKSPIGVSCVFLLLWVIGLILMFTPVGFPYTHATAPQRQVAHHAHSSFYNFEGTLRRESSMFFVRGSDRNNHLTGDYLGDLDNVDGIGECQTEWLCGLPLLWNAQQTSTLIEAPKPMVPGDDTDLRLSELIQLNSTTWRFSFNLTCSNHCAIYIAPAAQGATLGRWSMFRHLDEKNMNYPNPRLYFINFSNVHVEDRPELTFWLEVDLQGTITGKRLNIGIVSHYSAERDAYSQDYKDFLRLFPDWTTTTDWITTFTSYEF